MASYVCVMEQNAGCVRMFVCACVVVCMCVQARVTNVLASVQSTCPFIYMCTYINDLSLHLYIQICTGNFIHNEFVIAFVICTYAFVFNRSFSPCCWLTAQDISCHEGTLSTVK